MSANSGITVTLEMWNPFPGPSRPTFAVVGSCKQLGWWNPKRAIIAKPIDDDSREWRATLVVPRWYNTIEFRWLIIDTFNMEVCQWEETPIRILPLRQKEEKVKCWFDSKGTATKILPINRNDSVKKKAENLQKCLEEIKIYTSHNLDVEIRYEYFTSDVPDEDDDPTDGRSNRLVPSGEQNNDKGDVDKISDFSYNCNATVQCAGRVSTQIPLAGIVVPDDIKSPGGAADPSNRPRVHHSDNGFWSGAMSWSGLLTAGLLIGGGAVAFHFIKHL